ncbi:MAG: secreted glycosyl hydrolase [Fibrobacteres bacterium]|nr:secreted glycosyl hydrolase [Fibrobacterota bacterium]
MKTATLALLAAGFAVTSSHALTWTGCKDIANADFKAVPIATRAGDTAAEPMKMAFDLLASNTEDAKGKVDVYFTERLGKVRKFDSKTSKVITLAKFTLNINSTNSSDGVLGIALDPGFKSNNNVYIYYTYVGGTEKSWRISRFTLNAAHTSLDLASEVVVLKIPINSGSKHPGGAMQFDDKGDLWITVGNDYKDGSDYPLYSSPNTNDLRGKILRIHPTSDGKYTVPEGNLFKAGTANTRPEIYIMGNRNPYTLSLDPVRKWIVWGDVGPDNKNFDGADMNVGGPEKTEEYDLAKAPGNYGYPFFAGDFATKPGTNAAAPTMPAGYGWEGAQPGMTTLPPAVSPIYAYKKACAITGPIYRYDGDLNSSIKFPPHFTRKWLVSDFNGDANKITAFTLNNDGTQITAQENVIGIPLHGPLDMQAGPDGALYVNNYDGYRTSGPNTGLIRIEYIGDCHPAEPKLETSTSIAFQAARQGLAWQGPHVDVNMANGLSVTVATSERFSLEVRDLMGRPVASRSAQGTAPVALTEVRSAGIYFLHVKTSEGTQVIKVVRN